MTIATSPAAHSPKDLKKIMNSKEKYFQAIDKEAPSFTLQDADGRVRSLSDYRGKVVVLHFIYTGCPDVCPLHAERIAQIQSMISQTPMKDHVQFITITTDPKNDTSDVMRAYGPARGLKPDNWVFLTKTASQPEDATRSLAVSFGHKFTKVDGSYQVHSVVTHVVDREGRWRANFHGLKFRPINLVLFLNALTNNAATPHHPGEESLWDKVKIKMRSLF
jgi:protein SCO1/2